MSKISQYLNMIMLVVILLLLLRNCDRSGSREQKIKTDTLYLKPTDKWHVFPVEVPKPYKVEVPGAPGSTIAIPVNIDSLAVIRDYYTKRFYSDSLKNDSVVIWINETVSMNEIKSREIKYRWTAPERLIRNTIREDRQLFFIGADVTASKNALGTFGSVYFDTRKGLIGLGYDPFNRAGKITVAFKLKLWKRK